MKPLTIPLALAFALQTFLPAFAASTDWQDLGGGKARLIANKDPESGKLEGLVEIKLNKGWKTYWRSPGGSGIAPEFNFATSKDAIVEKVAFPSPEWISLPDATFYGYKDSVAFTFSGMADSASSELNLDLLIGVCEEICIPATAHFSLSPDQLNTSDPKSEISIALAKSKLPPPPTDDFKLAQAVLADDRIEVTGVAKSAQEIRVVVSLDSGWVSDPANIERDAEGAFKTSITLPPSILSQAKESDVVNYTLIEHEADSKKIIRIADGETAITKSVN